MVLRLHVHHLWCRLGLVVHWCLLIDDLRLMVATMMAMARLVIDYLGLLRGVVPSRTVISRHGFIEGKDVARFVRLLYR